MPSPYRVAIQGFSAFERSALASCFRLAAGRTPGYRQTGTLAEAQFVVVDADHAASVQAVQAATRVDNSVFIGSRAPEGAVAWMTRPIDPLHVMRELDAMVAAMAAQAAAPLRPVPPAPNKVPVAAADRRSRGTARTRPGPVPRRRATDSAETGFVVVPGPPPPSPTLHSVQALLVDHSDSIALRMLQTRLHRLGVRTERARTSGEAIELLSHKGYDFLFLDVDLGPDSELDGLSLCQHIKRHHLHVNAGNAPVVVLLSESHSELDRARGALAGADATLGKPLDEAQLARLMSRHGVAPASARAS